MLLGFGLVRAVEIRRVYRRVGAQQLVVPVRVAGPVHRVARGLHKPHRMRPCLRGNQQRDGRIDVHASGQDGLPIDERRDHRGEVNDHRGRRLGNQAVNLALIGQVRPVRLRARR